MDIFPKRQSTKKKKMDVFSYIKLTLKVLASIIRQRAEKGIQIEKVKRKKYNSRDIEMIQYLKDISR